MSEVVPAARKRHFKAAPVLRPTVRPNQILGHGLHAVQQDGYLLIPVSIKQHPALLHQHPQILLCGIETVS